MDEARPGISGDDKQRQCQPESPDDALATATLRPQGLSPRLDARTWIVSHPRGMLASHLLGPIPCLPVNRHIVRNRQLVGLRQVAERQDRVPASEQGVVLLMGWHEVVWSFRVDASMLRQEVEKQELEPLRQHTAADRNSRYQRRRLNFPAITLSHVADFPLTWSTTRSSWNR